MSLIVAIPCHQKDENQALRMLGWIAELGQVNAKAAIFCARDCNIEGLMQKARLAFTQPIHILDGENVKSNWSSDDQGSRDPSGPNSVFRQLVWNFYLAQNKEPWLLLEPDSVPMRSGWYEELLQEYQACGKPVMGDIVSTNSPHLSGVACYPFNVPELFPKMVHNTQGAFDMAESVAVLKAAHITKKIQDIWRCPPFHTQEDVAKIRPEACLFHASKDGSLIDRLRERKNGLRNTIEVSNPQAFAGVTASGLTVTKPGREVVEVSRVDPQGQLPPAGSNPAASTPVVDIYLKTWPRDYELANLLLKSIAKFVTGYRNVIIEAPDYAKGLELPTNLRGMLRPYSEDQPPGYLDQQKKKLACYKHSDASHFLMVDSDCCFSRPVDVSEFFRNGKSIWRHTPLNLARPDQSSAWVPVMRKFLGVEPTQEFMREHPAIFPRWLMLEMETFCRYKHRMELGDYIMAQALPGSETALVYSEFNTAGFLAWEFHHDKIEWIPDDQANPCLVQGHTWAGPERIERDIARHKAILGEDEAIEVVEHKELFMPRKHPEQPFTIEGALIVLATEASQSPLHKARLMKRITAALGNTKKPQAPKRRRGRPKKIHAGDSTNKPVVRPTGQLPTDTTGDLGNDTRHGFILAVQTYPGGNEAFERHSPFFRKSGASRLVAITTTDGKCKVPQGFEEVQIGDNKYISADHLPRRLLAIIEWFLQQPQGRIVIAEYDNVIHPIKSWGGMMLSKAGGKLPNSKASSFMHCPYFLDKESAQHLQLAMWTIISRDREDFKGPEASPDVFLSYAVDRAGIPFNEFSMFTRNTITPDNEEDKQKAREAFRKGWPVHGVKTKEVLDYITG